LPRYREIDAPLVLAAALVLSGPGLAAAATPVPTAPPRIDVQKLQPRALAPKKKLHVEYIVEVNKLGQVARVRSVKAIARSALRCAHLRQRAASVHPTSDGHVVLGTYRLIYELRSRHAAPSGATSPW